VVLGDHTRHRVRSSRLRGQRTHQSTATRRPRRIREGRPDARLASSTARPNRVRFSLCLVGHQLCSVCVRTGLKATSDAAVAVSAYGSGLEPGLGKRWRVAMGTPPDTLSVTLSLFSGTRTRRSSQSRSKSRPDTRVDSPIFFQNLSGA
jgi:hypothetical protein